MLLMYNRIINIWPAKLANCGDGAGIMATFVCSPVQLVGHFRPLKYRALPAMPPDEITIFLLQHSLKVHTWTGSKRGLEENVLLPTNLLSMVESENWASVRW